MGPDDSGFWYLTDCTGESWPVVERWKHHPFAKSLFGWTPCPCGKTDGTVDCEHFTAYEMIDDARLYLWDHNGEEITPPYHITLLHSWRPLLRWLRRFLLLEELFDGLAIY